MMAYYFSFRSDPLRRQLWLEARNLEKESFKSHMRNCSRHFKFDDFDSTSWPRRKLLTTAIPSPSKDYVVVKKRRTEEDTSSTFVPTCCTPGLSTSRLTVQSSIVSKPATSTSKQFLPTLKVEGRTHIWIINDSRWQVLLVYY